MIYRYKDPNPPTELIDPKWNALKQDALISMSKHLVNPKCYRDTTIDILLNLYNNKCAFCERDRGTELQVDHYRPKKPRNNITNPKYNQPGYYWLAYEWTNLIPLCLKCNQKKSNKFPLAGWSNAKRISNHLNINGIAGFSSNSLNWLQSFENPLLINPEYETSPEKHFSFRRDGTISGRTAEGIETIILCDLNRKDLRRERLKIRENYVNEINTVFDEFATSMDTSELKGGLKSVFRMIKKNCHFDEPHSLYHVFIYKYFSYFIDSKLPSNLRGQAAQYFNDFNKP